LGSQEGGEGVRVEDGSGPQLQGGHDLVTGHRIGHGVDDGEDDVAVAGEDAAHGGGGEVLPVDAQPVVGTTGEVEEAPIVAVGEVTGPVPAVAQAGLFGVVVVPVALEAGPPGLGDELSDGVVGVGEPAVGIEAGDGTLVTGGGVDDGGVGGGPAESTPGRVGCALDDGTTFGGAVGIDDAAPEARGEAGQVVLGPFVAEDPGQRVVGVVGPFGGGQDVGEGLTDVVEVGDAVTPDVGQEARRREAAAGGQGQRQPAIRALEWKRGMAT